MIQFSISILFKPLRGDRRPPTDGQGELGAKAREGQQTDRTLGKMWTNLDQNQGRHEWTTRRRESPKIVPKFLPGWSRDRPKSSPAPSPSTLERRKTTCDPTVAQKVAKVGPSRPKVAPKRPFWNPGGTPKSTKIEPGAEKVTPGGRFFPFFPPSRTEVAFRTHAGSVLGGSDPQNVARSPY